MAVCDWTECVRDDGDEMNKYVFSKELLKNACQEFGFWNNVRLLFRPENYSYEDGVLIKFKELDGKIFVEKIEFKSEA